MDPFKTELGKPQTRGNELAAENQARWNALLKRTRAESVTPSEIIKAPMLTTEWNQGAPYNYFCPSGSSYAERAVAGCVPVAIAQILKYYEWPLKAASVASHTDDKGDIQASMLAEHDFLIDWSAMQDSYEWKVEQNYGTSEYAVARLIMEIGVMLKADYELDGTVAFVNDIVDVLSNHFKYTVSVKSTASAADATAKEPSSANGSADKGKFTFTRTLPSGMTGALTVYYSVRGTATNGVDYKSLPGSITFPANADTVTCNVEPLFDGVDEDDETVEVVLEPANGAQTYRGGTYTDAAITIEDTEATVGPTPDTKYTLTVVNGTINGTTATTAQITAGEEVTITTKTLASGRAFGIWTASEDVEFTGSVMGSTTTFLMPAKNVTVTGSDVLKSSLQAVAVRSTTNQGDDTAKEPSSATVSASDKGKFTFTRTSSSGALTVYYAIRGTATNGVDYKSISGSIAFASGKTSVELPIEPLFDGVNEGDETVTVALAPAGG